MQDHDVERMLATLPGRSLPAGAEARVAAALRTGGCAESFWSRGVPRWQAATACAVLCAVAVLATLVLTTPARERTPAPIDHPTATPPPERQRFAERAQLDIARWRVVQVQTEEQP